MMIYSRVKIEIRCGMITVVTRVDSGNVIVDDGKSAKKDGMNLLQLKELSGGREVIRMKFPGSSGVDVVIVPPSPRGSPPPPELLPTIKLKPLDLDLQPGKDAEFKLVMENSKDGSVSWYKKGALLLNSGRIKTWQDGDCFFLKISNVVISDESLYEYKARNNYGETGSDVQLTVDEDGEEEEENEAEEGNEKIRSEDIIVPHVFFRRLKHEYIVTDGDTLLLEVETEGQPIVSWYYEGRQLREAGNEFIKITSNKNIHTLEIEETVIDDEGFYECVAKYEDNEISTSSDVIIEDRLPINDENLHQSLNYIDIENEDSSDELELLNGEVVSNHIGVSDSDSDDHGGGIHKDHSDGENEVTSSLPRYIAVESCEPSSTSSTTLTLEKGDCVEILNQTQCDMWLVRDILAKSRIGFVTPSILKECKS